jgi:very-short-patch-repair endonuclease
MRGPNEIKTERARRLRSQSTDAELKLWNRIRSRAINGYKLVRQEPIGPYVVDFVCRERRLIIEVDGGQHATDTRDAVRDEWLAAHRYRVMRFWNNDVLRNIDGVLQAIVTALAEDPPHPDRAPHDPTSPRKRGEVEPAACCRVPSDSVLRLRQ